MNLIDNKLSAIWRLLLPTKSDAIKQLKIWILMVKQETGKKIGRFNIDNGELKSKGFVELCESQGICPTWTSPYTSAQNGRVEQVHLTQFNAARTMQIVAGLPPNHEMNS